MQRDIPYPIPLGRSVAVPWDGDSPWHLMLFASMLNHLEVLSDRQKQDIVRNSLVQALRLCARHNARSLASVVLQGGWRLSADSARLEMEAAYASAGCPRVRLLVCQRRHP